MAVYEYLLDCPQCGQSEVIEMRVHATRDEDLWVANPKVLCLCALAEEDVEDLSEEAMEMAIDDLWECASRTDDDARFDSKRDWELEQSLRECE